jgi:hypothetical protein
MIASARRLAGGFAPECLYCLEFMQRFYSNA